jgi:hypothetical protein
MVGRLSERTNGAIAILSVAAVSLLASACVMDAPRTMSGPAPEHTTPAHDAGAPAHSSDAGATPHPTADMDPTKALASIANGLYETSTSFKRVSRVPYPSSAAQGMWIDNWISSDAYGEYAKVTPDAHGSNAALPEGAMIVRAVVNAKDETTKLTLMIKGPKGYNPELGDWWFGETDPNGVPLMENGAPLTGRLTQCYSCHIPRSGDDFLFGVPQVDRGVE